MAIDAPSRFRTQAFIDGRFVDAASGETFATENPANGAVIAQVRSWFADDSRTDVGTLVKLRLNNRGVSGRLISVTLVGADGTTKKVSGAVFVSVFNAHRPAGDPLLRSTLFDLAPIS